VHAQGAFGKAVFARFAYPKVIIDRIFRANLVDFRPYIENILETDFA